MAEKEYGFTGGNANDTGRREPETETTTTERIGFNKRRIITRGTILIGSGEMDGIACRRGSETTQRNSMGKRDMYRGGNFDAMG